MPDPFKVQLAFQGGGAKLVGLLAVAEVAQQLHSKQLKITRVAGTSAGAIAACLVAGEIPISEVRAYLVGGIGRKLADAFPAPSKLKMASSALRGRPFWRTAPLEHELAVLFQKYKLHTLGDLRKKSGIDVLVVAADLSNSQKVVHGPDQLIVSALMDSCALPFCFRTWARGGGAVIVDGGICENLPIAELQEKQDSDGPVVAVSFSRRREDSPVNLLSFSKALLDTAISNSMNRARSALTADSIFEIDTSIGTFDFEQAITFGLKEPYDLIKGQAEKFLEAFVETRTKPTATVRGDPWSEKNPLAVEMMRGLGQIYFSQYAKHTFKYLDCAFEVTANCLLPESEFRHADRMKYSAWFEPIDQPIHCISIALMSSPEGFLGKTLLDLRDENKNQVGSVSLPAINDDFPSDRELLHFINPIIEPGQGKFRWVIRDEAYDLMGPLAKTGIDELAFFPRRARGRVDLIRIVLHVPKSCPNVVMIPKAQGQQGRAMTEKKLAEFEERPFDFYSIGWIGEQVQTTDSFGVDVRK